MTGSGLCEFLDPDGRPWRQTLDDDELYYQAVLGALKAAFLTQELTYIPIGYAFDSPFIQWAILRHRVGHRKDVEARAFRALAQQAIRILHDGAQDGELITDWKDQLVRWVRGATSNRGRHVYLNCLPHDVAVSCQELPTDRFLRTLAEGLRIRNVELADLLRECRDIGFYATQPAPFPFDDILRSQLLSGADDVPSHQGAIRDKLQKIALASEANDIRLSRSLIQSELLCGQLGVVALSQAEYSRIAPALANYHHQAFARSLGLEGSSRCPLSTSDTVDVLSERIEQVLVARWRDRARGLPLAHIRFQDVWAVRADRRFAPAVREIHRARRNGDVRAYAEALHDHMRTIASIVSLDFRRVSIDELVDTAVDAATAPTAKVWQKSIRVTCALVTDVVPNLRRELDVRWFFGSIGARRHGYWSQRRMRPTSHRGASD